MAKKSLALIAALLASACTTLGPDHAVPSVTGGEASWLEPAQTGAIEPVWWNSFDDPLLSELIERALTNAPSMAEAEARIAEARANRAEVIGGTYPQVQASGSANENQISENGQFPAAQIPNFPTGFSLFDAGFDTSWELDLWGQRRRAVEAVDAQILAAEAGRDAAMVTLTAEIARTYAELRVAQALVETAQASHASRGTLAQMTQLLRDAGEGGGVEAETAAAQYAAQAGQVRLAQARAASAAYRIAALMGEPPEAIASSLLEIAPIPQAPDAIMVGIRSDLLRRRPDIRMAERQLAAATAEIGFRQAELFPSFSLLGSIGFQARRPGDLLDSGSLRFSIGPRFSWPIFSAGRIRAQVAAADARAQGAAARYEGAVASALAESESAINRWLAARAAQDSATQAFERQSRGFALAQLRHDRGEDSAIDLENARLPLIASQNAMLQAQGASSEAAIALYKALGGGWQVELGAGE